MKPQTDLDYVILYAKTLARDNSHFEQQKKLIDSQMQISREMFRKMFGKDFKKNARIYLRKRGII